jgi:hypothetical protein
MSEIFEEEKFMPMKHGTDYDASNCHHGWPTTKA